MSEIRSGEWVLIGKDRYPVTNDQEYENFRYEKYRIAGGHPPHKPSSTGRVWVFKTGSDLKDTYEVYPTIFGMRWVKYDSPEIKRRMELVKD